MTDFRSPTVKVKTKSGDEVRINASDFNPNIHKLVDGEEASGSYADIPNANDALAENTARSYTGAAPTKEQIEHGIATGDPLTKAQLAKSRADVATDAALKDIAGDTLGLADAVRAGADPKKLREVVATAQADVAKVATENPALGHPGVGNSKTGDALGSDAASRAAARDAEGKEKGDKSGAGK